MNSYRDVFNGLSQLGIERHQPVMVHVAESSYEKVKGGAETILAALLATVDDIIAPSFTHQTLIIPKEGPRTNAMDYGIGDEVNASAEFFHPDLAPDLDLGRFIEVLRMHPQARRSDHPIYSFSRNWRRYGSPYTKLVGTAEHNWSVAGFGRLGFAGWK